MKDDSAIVPFGKYKDQPVELLLADADEHCAGLSAA